MQARLRLEAAEEANDKGVVDEGEDVSLGEHLLHLIAQHKRRLPHALHREAPARVAVPHQIHRSAHSHTHMQHVENEHSPAGKQQSLPTILREQKSS